MRVCCVIRKHTHAYTFVCNKVWFIHVAILANRKKKRSVVRIMLQYVRYCIILYSAAARVGILLVLIRVRPKTKKNKIPKPFVSISLHT